MDSLTQIVLGAAVGEAVLGKKTGNKALLYGAIVGTIPDLDVLFGKFTDSITAIEWHRGFSHSLLFSILAACVLGWLMHRVEHKRNLGWKSWAILCFLCLFTHAVLDAFTSWGTQLLWPIRTRFAWSSIFVIDPLYTIPFLICTIAVLCYKRTSKKRRRWNRIGLIISTSYLISTLGIKAFVTNVFKKALSEQGIAYTQLSIRPAPLTTFLWNANVATNEAYLIGDYSFFDSQPILFKTYPKQRHLSKYLLNYQNVQRLIDISEGWYIIDTKTIPWVFNDLRFGLIYRKDGTSFFSFSYNLEAQNGTIKVTETPKTKGDAHFLMKRLWNRIKGN